MIYKIVATALFVLIPLVSFLITKFCQLHRLGLKFPDLAFPALSVAAFFLSKQFFLHSLLPHYLILLSLLAIFVSFWLLNKQPNYFSYKAFFKLFWRTGFLVTLVFYLGMLVMIFLLK
ncbi:DUF3397 domain-containing protein [Streptococcus sp. sy004]|uniref:DUF3397 domain-containing protein n=2 Tax=Streptococcus TaxID=1301 RepID=UPI0021BDEC9B|nr:DUF3397 domain-containing protein [Streptococcus sp. sy004]